MGAFRSKMRKSSSPGAEGGAGGGDSGVDDIDPVADGSHYNSAAGRRKSVFTESYDPEEDEDDGKPVIYPKSDAQRKSLLDAVKGILIFRSLEQEQLGEVLDAMFQREVVEEEYIIKQGNDGDNFYVINSGKYNIFVNTGPGGDKLVGNYTDTGSFGELALMYNMPRAATIQAVTKGTLWAMDRSTFRRIVLKAAFQKRKTYEALLEQVPLLTSLSEYERMNLADALVSQSHPDSSVIVAQGGPGDGMYFVEDGEVEITMVGKDNVEKKLTTIRKGGYFGELALVTHKPRAATAKANGPVKVAFLDVHAFERLLGPCMVVMQRNIKDYEQQVVKLFGSKAGLTDTR
jgi:cAMP-dependent protein kinase regulator